MRLLFPVAILAMAASAPAAAKPALINPDCPEARNLMANKGGAWRGKPRKLSQLPPADAFAAVLRRDERGCMVMVKYRDIGR
jgi:hypothetical protein